MSSLVPPVSNAPSSTGVATMEAVTLPLRYCEGLRSPVQEIISSGPHVKSHRREWEKVMNGDPVEINPSSGSGYKVMAVEEWSSRWKRNEDFPACLSCGSESTREHYFVQTWCRGRRMWECESICTDCLKFSYRSYQDPKFKTPYQYEKERWSNLEDLS